MPGHYHNKHEVPLQAKDTESIEEAGINYQKLMAHQVNVSLGIESGVDIMSHGKSDGQISVNTVADAVAAPKIDERNVYTLEDL